MLRGKIKEEAEEVVLRTNQFTGIALLFHPLYKNFKLLQVATPYVTFAMDGEGRKWDTETGRISVSTSLDLSYHVARLMKDTGKCKVEMPVLEKVLKDVYWFGEKIEKDDEEEESSE